MSGDAGILTPVIPLVFFGASVVAIYDPVLWSDAHWDGATARPAWLHRQEPRRRYAGLRGN